MLGLIDGLVIGWLGMAFPPIDVTRARDPRMWPSHVTLALYVQWGGGARLCEDDTRQAHRTASGDPDTNRVLRGANRV